MPYRVLFADLQPMLVEVMNFTMDESDFELVTSQSFQKTYSLINEQKFDLIILDYELNALELVQFAKKSQLNADTDIFIMSFSTDSELKKEAKKLGVSGWIIKPFIPENFVKKLKEYLDSNTKQQ